MWRDNHKFCEALTTACVPSYEPVFHLREGYATRGLTRHVPDQDQAILDQIEVFGSQGDSWYTDGVAYETQEIRCEFDD
jgi:hypothetical protein